jgi:hypothetical protein
MLIKQLFETPIEDFALHGNWNKNSSYKEQDRKLLTNPKAQEKIKQQWLNTTIPFNFYFVNSPEANRHTEVGEVGRNWLYENMPKFYEEMVKEGKITSNDLLSPEAINVIFTNNKGSERVPMTAWILGHRLGHVLYRKGGINGSYEFEKFTKTFKMYLKEIMKLYRIDVGHNFVNQPPSYFLFRNAEEIPITLKKFVQEIGTFKSARDKKLRTFFEFYCELIAQYLITGTIKFNPCPAIFKGYKGQYYRCSNLEDANIELVSMRENTEEDIENLLGASIGKVYVM